MWDTFFTPKNQKRLYFRPSLPFSTTPNFASFVHHPQIHSKLIWESRRLVTWIRF